MTNGTATSSNRGRRDAFLIFAVASLIAVASGAATLAANGVMIGENGVADKDTVVKGIADMPCEVKSFALSDWKINLIDSDAAVVTYKGVAEGTCAGTPIPAVWASSVWVKSGGRWRAFSHQETPVK